MGEQKTNATSIKFLYKKWYENLRVKVSVSQVLIVLSQMSQNKHATTCQQNWTAEQNTRRGVYIRQRVCDRQRMARYCKTIPLSYCQNNPGQQCRMEPRTVCQPTCEKSSYCNQCSQFANYGGFSQCPSQTCPNYISPTAN